MRLDSAQWLATGSFIQTGGHRIFVRASGAERERETIFFLHGFPTSSWDWSAVEPYLSSSRRLVFFDFLGFGNSEKPRAHRYDLMEQASIAQAVAKHFDLRRTRLVAHDYGSSVAQELLARDMEGSLGFELSDVTLLNGGIYPDLHRPLLIQRLLRSPVGPLVSAAATERTAMRALASVFSADHRPAPQSLHEHWLLMQRGGGARLGHRLIHYISDRFANERRWVGALEATHVPLRFVWGMRDPVSGAHVMDRLRSRFDERSRLIALDDVGHYPQLEAPERVAAAISS